MADTIVFADKPETVLRKSPKKSAKAVNHVLLGTWLKVVDEDGGVPSVRHIERVGIDGQGDRFDKRLICVACMLGHAGGMFLIAFAFHPIMVIGFAVLNGLGWGTRGPLMVALRADYFGSSAFGTIMGFSSLIRS